MSIQLLKRPTIGRVIELGDVITAIRRAEALLGELGAWQCEGCGHLHGKGTVQMMGICLDCWKWNEELGEKVSFQGYCDHDIAVHWITLRWMDCLAGWTPRAGADTMEPHEWLIAAGMLCAIGEQRIRRALAKHERGVKFVDPLSLRWNQGIGLVPNRERVERTPVQWRLFWTEQLGKAA